MSGFRENRWRTVQQIRKGEYLLCYLTGISRWVGVLEFASGAFRDTIRDPRADPQSTPAES